MLSGIYLGNGWMLTANHVSPATVTLAGSTTIGCRSGAPSRTCARLTDAVYAAEGIKRPVPAKPGAVEAPAAE